MGEELSMSAHGTFHWNELITSDVEAAKRFFADTLDWSYQDMKMPNGVYTVAIAGERPAAGIMAKDLVPGLLTVPSHWFGYIAVDDIDRLQPVEQLKQQVSHALQGVSAAEADDLFGQHRLLARRGPCHRRRQLREIPEQIPDLGRGQGRDRRHGQGYDRMVGNAEEMSPKPYEIAGQNEIEHLPTPVGQGLISVRPARLENEDLIAHALRPDELLARRHRLHLGGGAVEPVDLSIGKAGEHAQLSGEGIFGDRIHSNDRSWPFLPP